MKQKKESTPQAYTASLHSRHENLQAGPDKSSSTPKGVPREKNNFSTKGKISTKGERFEISSKELKINLEKLQQDVKKAYETMKNVLPSAIKDVEIKKFGNAAHIVLPKEYTGKKATVLIRK